MTRRAPGRKSALTALTAVALLALGALAPMASAQVSTSQIAGTDPIGTVTDTIGGVTGGDGDSGGSTSVGGGGGTVGTGTVTDTIDKTVGTTTGTTDNPAGGVGTIVGSTGDKVKETTEQTQKTIDNTTNQTGTTVDNTINDTGGSVTNPLLNVKDPQAKDVDGDGRISNKERNTYSGGHTSKKAAYGGEPAAGSRKNSDRTKFGSLAAAERKSRNAFSSTPAFTVAPPREGFIDQLAQVATEAAEKLAFPLGLALMVGAFLMLQGRIDRKDAKLVLAPIDSEQDLLSFQ